MAFEVRHLTLDLKYDSKAIWDRGTSVSFIVSMTNDSMVLQQSGGDGPALTTMGQVIELKRAE